MGHGGPVYNQAIGKRRDRSAETAFFGFLGFIKNQVAEPVFLPRIIDIICDRRFRMPVSVLTHSGAALPTVYAHQNAGIIVNKVRLTYTINE
jgi:hypothetical protein